ncbi:TetR/AcrR family transcriptional regulator [Kurthia sibirica]|uniref:TetR/AcrR family transcriptional regulator n=1 Tax=Kurthia sibirica TaxID=202750 RepID=A0A2U3AI37_9BACL|nr:TetR/AcrR family transcriptional regulator [Kurthia sibirica]PWI24208.1 TetR/AcrR family transcriptional regulator [Kurthia sibirica]GEK34831.1 hypothetical protein KSI01_23640 [Kurthia sibirica]
MNNRKRQVILACAKLFAEKGFISTSIQDILDESHISKGTFYNYFSSKQDCLIAILDIGSEEAAIRKQEFLIGKDLDDKKVLASQISTIMQVNRERNLLPIFESILHSGDKELKKTVQQYHIREMEWLSGRMIDVYGEKIRPYRYDATILLFGMINQHLHIGSLTHAPESECPSPVDASHYALRQLDSIIPSLIKNKDSYLGPSLERYIYANKDHIIPSQSDIIDQLKGFRKNLEPTTPDDCIEFTDCLIEEFSSPNPRYYIISTVAFKFYDTFRKSNHASEAIAIANGVWQITRARKDEAEALK